MRKQSFRNNFIQLKEGRISANKLRRVRNKRFIIASRTGYKTHRLLMPSNVNLHQSEDRNKLLSLTNKAIRLLRDPMAKIHLDFRDAKKMQPCGTLYFMAHIDALLTKYSGRISCNYPDDEVVGQLFQHFGLLERMGLSPKWKITAENVLPWHYVVGTKTDTSKFDDLLHAYENELDQPMRMGLYDSMSEAVTNCTHHAYEHAPEMPQAEQKWWMFAQKKESLLSVTIYDAGIGIPASLQRKPELRDMIKSYLLSKRQIDKRLLMAAVGSNKSRTKLPYRGLGLPEMLNFIQSNTQGGLMIHSNRGSFVYSAVNDKHTSGYYNEALIGTLIQWTLPLVDGVQHG